MSNNSNFISQIIEGLDGAAGLIGDLGPDTGAIACVDASVNESCFFDIFEHVMGCGHVSGLECATFLKAAGRYG